MVLVPSHVPAAFISMYLPAIYAALIVGFIGSMAIALNRRDIHILILTDLIGLAMIILGSHFSVESATFLAEKMGVSDKFIGLTVVALGTSLPELFTSVSAAMKKNADIAIGNIVGSNIFNILFIVGITSIITPVGFVSSFRIDTIIAFAVGIALWLFALKGRTLKRWGGIAMLAMYGAYFAYLLVIG